MTLEASKIVVNSIDRKNKQWSQWLAVISATVTLFSAGICFTWTSPSLVILQSPDTPFNITNNEASWIAACMPFGSALGPIFGSFMSRTLGPKQSILWSSIPFILGFILITVANGPMLLYVSRFVSGIGVGFAFTAVPIYIAEIAEDHNRGGLMILFTMMLSFGSFFMTCLGPYISLPSMALISLAFPIIGIVTFIFVPESPYFLMRSGNERKSASSLMWLRRQKDLKAIESELDNIRRSVENDNLSIIQCLKQIVVSPNPKALIIIFMIILEQQFSGILAVSFYQEQIYRDSNIPMRAELAVILSQIISNISGVSSIFIVDRWGRKPLLFVSAFGCALSTALIGFYYETSSLQDSLPWFRWLPVVACNLFLVAFSLGLGPIPYTILGEVFGSEFKEVAICIISISGALAGTFVAKVFQIINDSYSSSVVFFSLSISTLIAMIIVNIITPETMNKSFMDIQKILLGDSYEKEKQKKENTIQITRF